MVLDLLDLALGIHVAQAERRERDDPRALHRLGDHRLDRRRHLRVRQRLGEMGFRTEQEVQRHHPGLRRERGGIGGRGDAEFDVAGLHQLQHLRLLPELRARILVDQHGALAELLEPVAEGVADNAVARAFRLIVGEAEAADLLRPGDPRRRKHHTGYDGCRRQSGNGVPSGDAHSQPSLMCPLVFLLWWRMIVSPSVTSLSRAGKALCERKHHRAAAQAPASRVTHRSIAGMTPTILPEIGGRAVIAERGHRSIHRDHRAGNRARRIIVQVVHPAIHIAVMMPMMMAPMMPMPVMMVATMMRTGEGRTREQAQHRGETKSLTMWHPLENSRIKRVDTPECSRPLRRPAPDSGRRGPPSCQAGVRHSSVSEDVPQRAS